MTHSTTLDGASPGAPPENGWVRRGQQVLGLGVLLFAFAPLYRVMDTSAEAPHREVSVEVAEVTLQLAWWGTIVTVLLAWTLARLFPPRLPRVAGRRLLGWIERPSSGAFALALGALSGAIAVFTGRVLYQGLFTNVDEIASTLQARYLAQGMLAGPISEAPDAWLIPNTLMVAEGWVSHFPPTHLFAMAALTRLGAPMLLGPLFAAALSGLVALSLPRLLPDQRGLARVAALAVALSPFLLFLGGGSMSHVSAGAFGAAALYAALRARDGSPWWALGAGAAVGLMVSGRPFVGLVLGSVFTLGIWVPSAVRSAAPSAAWMTPRVGLTLLGGAPFAIMLGWYNGRLFGNPLTLGYLAGLGDHHRLGFHMDPWGYPYTLEEALGFTSSDVLSMGIQLLETPFPVTAFIGLYLLTATSLPQGMGVLLAWAILPVLANGYYWFHDVRMLFEAAPAWIAISVLAALALAGGPGQDAGQDADVPSTAYRSEGDDHAEPAQEPAPYSRIAANRWARDMATWAIVLGVLGAVVWGVPSRWGSYGWSQETLERITPPEPPTESAAIVFVHTSWNERLSATLQGVGGVRQDTVITALRRNTNCQLHLYALGRAAIARGSRDVTLPEVDLDQIPGTPPDIQRPPAPTGATLRIRPNEVFPDSCIQQLHADRFGAVALAPLVWQGDLPGIERGLPLFVRDLGPGKNRRILALYPDRAAFVFVPKAPEAAPELVSYAEAMAILWGPIP